MKIFKTKIIINKTYIRRENDLVFIEEYMNHLLMENLYFNYQQIGQRL
jgi:hypothetical protein